MTCDQFIGIWNLVSYEFRLSDGIVVRPMGQGVRGMVIYDPSGWMMLQVMDPERPRFASGDWLRGTPEEIQFAWEGAFAYFGTYDVDDQCGKVVHHVQGAAFPNWIGIDRELFAEFSENRLVLMSLPMPLAGEQAVGYLTWERAK